MSPTVTITVPFALAAAVFEALRPILGDALTYSTESTDPDEPIQLTPPAEEPAEEPAAEPAKRGRGRPPGARNKKGLQAPVADPAATMAAAESAKAAPIELADLRLLVQQKCADEKDTGLARCAQLFKQYGLKRLSDLPASKFAEFAAALAQPALELS